MEITDQHFHELIDRAFDSLPQTHRDRVKNVAIITADEPTEEQRKELKLRCNETLLGLYSGIPLSERQGREPIMPDVITLFKWPLLDHSIDEASLYEHIRHTLWHEVAHYYGLNHTQIHALE
ncbi:metallopeptidase family protein [Candidatus Saccharibacteria bacterium]|nr:metallopeptidase family protein [Candidatus Saccharibacteria bacterium]